MATLFPTPPFSTEKYPLEPVSALTGNEWAIRILGNPTWTLNQETQGKFIEEEQCVESIEEFEGLQTVLVGGSTKELFCVSYICLSGDGATDVDIAVYPSTLDNATKYLGWNGSEFADDPAVEVNGYYWYRLEVHWASKFTSPNQDPNSVFYAKTYRYSGGGHAPAFKLWAFKHTLKDINNWYGEYETDLESSGAIFSPLKISLDGKVTIKGEEVQFGYDANGASLSLPSTTLSTGESFDSGTITFNETDSQVQFTGTIDMSDSSYVFTGSSPITQELRVTVDELTNLANDYSIDISDDDIQELADSLPTFPATDNKKRNEHHIFTENENRAVSWTVGAFLGSIAGGIVGGVAGGIVGGPLGAIGGAGAGAAAGANIGATLAYSVPPIQVVQAIELENVHGCCVDANGESYPVGWKPWIADLKSWRTYDPTTIPGVGLLVGIRTNIDGTQDLIGKELITREEVVLRDRDEGGHYSWVFTPDQAIIYKWNSGELITSGDYIRHSQLGGGEPVICAGEFNLDQEAAINIMLATINDSSGHYTPDGGKCMGPVLNKLESLGIDTTDIKVTTR